MQWRQASKMMIKRKEGKNTKSKNTESKKKINIKFNLKQKKQQHRAYKNEKRERRVHVLHLLMAKGEKSK